MSREESPEPPPRRAAADAARDLDPLVSVLRFHFGGGILDSRAWPSTGPAWERLLERARAHGCTALLHAAVTSAARELPDGVSRSLRQRALGRTARSAFLADRLRVHVQTLARSGLRVLCVKGPMLAELAYGDGSLRDFDDIDFLVGAADFDAARRGLIEQGLVPEFSAPSQAHTRGGWDCMLWSPARDYFVELSMLGMPRYFFRMCPGELWRDPLPVTVAGALCDAPAVEVQLVLLAAHGAKHGWCRYMWVADIAGLLSQCDVNWERLTNLAQQCGASRMVRVALVLASEVCATVLPAAAAVFVERDTKIPWLVEDCLRRLRDGDGLQPSGSEIIRFHLRCRGRWRDRFRYLLLLAVLPGYSDWHGVEETPFGYWLCYIRRPIRIAASLLRRLGSGARVKGLAR